jgi:hypothetical protein
MNPNKRRAPIGLLALIIIIGFAVGVLFKLFF